jgi:serine/threonine-protein kinase RsbT
VTSVQIVQSSTIEIAGDHDVVRVRQAMRTLAVDAALSLVDQTKIVTAASEIARNTLIYAGGGTAQLELISDGSRRLGARGSFIDHGPGISDIDQAMTVGYSTGGGLGLGLSGARRLVDEFEIDSTPGEGTRVVITKWGR